MSAAPSEAPATVELGGGFIYVRRPDGRAAILAPHLQTAGVAGMMSPSSVNARDANDFRIWLEHWGFEASLPIAQVNQVHGVAVVRARPGDPARALGAGSRRLHLSVDPTGLREGSRGERAFSLDSGCRWCPSPA